MTFIFGMGVLIETCRLFQILEPRKAAKILTLTDCYFRFILIYRAFTSSEIIIEEEEEQEEEEEEGEEEEEEEEKKKKKISLTMRIDENKT